MINNLCFNNLELYLDIFVLIQPKRIEIYCNYLIVFTFELNLGFVTFRTLIVSPVIGPFILMFHSTFMTTFSWEQDFVWKIHRCKCEFIIVNVSITFCLIASFYLWTVSYMNIWQRTVYLSNTFLLWLSIDYEIGKCKQYWFAHLFYLYNYFTYCKIVSFLLFTGITRFTHKFTYCLQCHIGCDNELTVYIRLVS
jgi:hypothetical protein